MTADVPNSLHLERGKYVDTPFWIIALQNTPMLIGALGEKNIMKGVLKAKKPETMNTVSPLS